MIRRPENGIFPLTRETDFHILLMNSFARGDVAIFLSPKSLNLCSARQASLPSFQCINPTSVSIE